MRNLFLFLELIRQLYLKAIGLASEIIMLNRILGFLLGLWLLSSSPSFGQEMWPFVQNKGQWPSHVTAAADIPGGKLWLQQDGWTFQLFHESFFRAIHPSSAKDTSSLIKGHNFKVKLIGASTPTCFGSDSSSFIKNYYLSNTSAEGVRSFKHWNFDNIYDGIDARFYTTKQSIKYDFIVAPHTSPNTIAMEYQGVDDIRIVNRQLRIQLSVGNLAELKPFAYQIINGKIHEVECKFVLKEKVVSFDLGLFDENYALIIDPEIAFSTFVGSTADNFGFTACNDSQERLIGSGAVFNPGFPTTVGAFDETFNSSGTNVMDVHITKFAADGSSILYATYLGGSLQETPHSIITDSEDNIILMGVTGSSDFPVTAGVFQSSFMGGPFLVMTPYFTSSHPEGCDLFITKLNSQGQMFRSTFVGGAENDGLNIVDQLFYNYGDCFRGEVNIDDQDNIYVASVTQGGFPIPNAGTQSTYGGGASDGILFKMEPDLSTMLVGTYIGGFDGDTCLGVEFDNDGNVLLAGGTKSANFPYCTNGADTEFDFETDGYIVRMSPVDLSVINGTFIGTMQFDQVYFVQTDIAGNVYSLGLTEGVMPISPGLYGQPNSGLFLRKFSPDLSTVTWTTTIGTGSGSPDISPTAFLVSDCDQIFFSGWGGGTNNLCGLVYSCSQPQMSTTTGLPVSTDAFQPNTDGSDFYLCVLGSDASELIYGSFLGGNISQEHVDGGTSRFAKNGTVYQAACAGCGGNSDFPTTSNAWSNTNPAPSCNLAVFRFNLGTIQAEVEIDGPTTICEDTPVDFQNLSIGGNNFEWTFGDGNTSNDFNAQHLYTEPGTYTVNLIVNETTECLIGDTAVVTLTVLPGVNPIIDELPVFCPETSFQLSGSGSDNAFWIANPYLSNPDELDPLAVAMPGTTFFLVDSNQCEIDTASVTVQTYDINFTISPFQIICTGETASLTASGGVVYLWSPGETLSSTSGPSVVAEPLSTTTYSMIGTTADGCQDTLTTTVQVDLIDIGGQIYDTIRLCLGSSVELNSTLVSNYTWNPSTGLSNPNIQNPIASPTETTTYTVFLQNTCASGTDQVTVSVVYPLGSASGGGYVCRGNGIAVLASGGVVYDWQPSATVIDESADSTLVFPQTSTTYTVEILDENGCTTFQDVFVGVYPDPPVEAGPDQSFEAPGQAQLMGNPFEQHFFWTPNTALSCDTCTHPFVSPTVPTYYTLHVIDNNGCTSKDSALVRPFYPLYVPNTVTPNNDGLNDVFLAVGPPVDGFLLKIFNRWGDKIFETTDQTEPWIPGINNHYVQDGVYTWIIEFESIERRKQLVGHVTVLR